MRPALASRHKGRERAGPVTEAEPACQGRSDLGDGWLEGGAEMPRPWIPPGHERGLVGGVAPIPTSARDSKAAPREFAYPLEGKGAIQVMGQGLYKCMGRNYAPYFGAWL
jgi:hypothetical protein